MEETFKLFLTFLLIFFSAIGFGYVTTHKKTKPKRKIFTPTPNSSVRLKSNRGLYRSRFIEESEIGWVFSAPLQKSCYIPLRINENLVMEAETDQGLIIFRSVIIHRSLDEHYFTIKKPTKTFLKDYRSINNYNDNIC